MNKKEDKKINEKFSTALNNLTSITNNKTIPKDIRRAAQESIEMLNDKDTSLAVRAANAISRLEEPATDHKLPSFARVAIWSTVSNLEAIRD
jgi:uncharacterized protein (UPF0147 family)